MRSGWGLIVRELSRHWHLLRTAACLWGTANNTACSQGIPRAGLERRLQRLSSTWGGRGVYFEVGRLHQDITHGRRSTHLHAIRHATRRLEMRFAAPPHSICIPTPHTSMKLFHPAARAPLSPSLHAYICICMSMHIYAHICIYLQTCMYVYLHVVACKYTYTRPCRCVCGCVCAHVYVCVRVNM